MVSIQDNEWVEHMALSPNATDIPGQPSQVVVLHVPDELIAKEGIVKIVNEAKARDEFIGTIRHHLSHNHSMLIREWYPDRRYGFSVEDIGMVRAFMGQEVHWQGKLHFIRYTNLTGLISRWYGASSKFPPNSRRCGRDTQGVNLGRVRS
jgi:hypothetical protein